MARADHICVKEGFCYHIRKLNRRDQVRPIDDPEILEQKERQEANRVRQANAEQLVRHRRAEEIVNYMVPDIANRVSGQEMTIRIAALLKEMPEFKVSHSQIMNEIREADRAVQEAANGS